MLFLLIVLCVDYEDEREMSKFLYVCVCQMVCVNGYLVFPPPLNTPPFNSNLDCQCVLSQSKLSARCPNKE